MMIYLLLVINCTSSTTKNFSLKCVPKTNSFYMGKAECEAAKENVPASQCIEVKVTKQSDH